MVNSFAFSVLVGLLMGILAGLGIGGGSLLILWLTIVLQIDQTKARSINLMFFIFAALSVSLIRWKKGKLNWKVILPASISGCIAAGLSSWLSTNWNTDSIKTYFGILLIITGLRELFYRPRKAK